MASKRGLMRGKKQEDVRSISPSDDNAAEFYEEQRNQLSSEPVAAKVEQAQTQVDAMRSALIGTAELITVRRQQVTPITQRSNPMSETVSLFEFSTDLSEAEAPAPLPVGEYPATIVKCEIKDSKVGNKYLAVSFRIDPESYPADFDEGNPEGETFTYNRLALLDTPQGRHRARKFNESVGAALGSRIDPNEYMGLTANIGIVHDTWEGEKRAQIAKVLSA